jgi:hypothetical protein
MPALRAMRRPTLAVEEGLLDRSPAVHVRRPRLDYESNATARSSGRHEHRKGLATADRIFAGVPGIVLVP